MTIVRIVLADPRTGAPPAGGAGNGRHLIVLADTEIEPDDYRGRTVTFRGDLRSAQVPADAISIIFGVYLNGHGQIELRNPQLDPHPDAECGGEHARHR